MVVYDHLVSAATARPRAGDGLRDLRRQVGRPCTLTQPEINDLLVEHARLGRGSSGSRGAIPFVFGRGAEEAEHLRRCGIPFRVVPGVTAGVGVTAYAGIPVTHRDAASAVAFVTGHDDPELAEFAGSTGPPSPGSPAPWSSTWASPGSGTSAGP